MSQKTDADFVRSFKREPTSASSPETTERAERRNYRIEQIAARLEAKRNPAYLVYAAFFFSMLVPVIGLAFVAPHWAIAALSLPLSVVTGAAGVMAFREWLNP